MLKKIFKLLLDFYWSVITFSRDINDNILKDVPSAVLEQIRILIVVNFLCKTVFQYQLNTVIGEQSRSILGQKIEARKMSKNCFGLCIGMIIAIARGQI